MKDTMKIDIFNELGLKDTNPGTCHTSWEDSGNYTDVTTPVDGSLLGRVSLTTPDQYEQAVTEAAKAFKQWRNVAPPKRGEIVRQLGLALREKKQPLGALVSLEMGKSLQEGLGEVQEMIDICDFAVGQSRMLYGVQTQSEREDHRLFEQWHPYGITGIITAFNFPVAVWAWNTAMALTCGNTCVWKPAPATPLTGVACQKILQQVLKDNDQPPAISTLVCGDKDIGEKISTDTRIPLVSFTGSCRVGKLVAEKVAARLGRCILELGGNNAIIVTPHADLDLAAKNILFGAVGTAGQRCTTTRRVIVADEVADHLIECLKKTYTQVKIGTPLDESNHMGPLINQQTVQQYLNALKTVEEQGGRFIIRGEALAGDEYPGGRYVSPSVAEIDYDAPIVQTETFAPLLYVLRYKGDLDEALAIQNSVPQGLSSAIFTNNLLESERFLSARGSDCGIANVNVGTSGAEIGLAFGGEKETGGGRESGSDAWKGYMRRQTCTVNWSGGTALAQGIKFD